MSYSCVLGRKGGSSRPRCSISSALRSFERSFPIRCNAGERHYIDMKFFNVRSLLLAVASLAVLAVVAGPAHATATPASFRFSASSTNSNLTDESNGLRTRCPLADFTGSTSADGLSISGTLTFRAIRGTTCTESLFGSSVTVVCRGNVTLRSTSSVATRDRTRPVDGSASGTAVLDAGFECTIRPVLAGPRSIRGPQTPTNCTWTFTVATQTLTTVCNTIAVDGGGESGFSASYRVLGRTAITIS